MIFKTLKLAEQRGWHIFVDLDTYLNIFQIKLLIRFVSFTFMDKRPSLTRFYGNIFIQGGDEILCDLNTTVCGHYEKNQKYLYISVECYSSVILKYIVKVKYSTRSIP